MEVVEGEAIDHIAYINNPREVNEGLLLAKMVDRISKSHQSKLDRETRTNQWRCTFRLPGRLKNINGMSFEPQVVSLGPYHHGKPQLQNMEEFKWRCLASLIESGEEGKLEECLIQLRPFEEEVREWYSESETIEFSSDEFLQMMVVDGFFILALFFSIVPNLTELDQDERSIFDNPLYMLDMVILPKIYRDLLLLENQVPSSVLETIYKICFNISSRKSLFVIATNFLCSISVIPESKNMPTDGLDWLHLLDLVRSIFILCRHNKETRRTNIRPFNPIPCVTKLRRAGIKVNRHMADSFLDVKFKNGVIEMPDIILDDSMCSLLVNCVVFEQSCNISKHFSIYTMLLCCLVNTSRDVNYLCDCRVVDNFIGTDDEASQFINNVGKDLTIYKHHGNNIDDLFLFDVFGDVYKYYFRKRLSWGKWTSFSFVGIVLLVLTFLQTYYNIYAYYVHPKN